MPTSVGYNFLVFVVAVALGKDFIVANNLGSWLSDNNGRSRTEGCKSEEVGEKHLGGLKSSYYLYELERGVILI